MKLLELGSAIKSPKVLSDAIMSEREVKSEDEHKEIQEDGGDDEVRDGPSCSISRHGPLRRSSCSRFKIKEYGDHH